MLPSRRGASMEGKRGLNISPSGLVALLPALTFAQAAGRIWAHPSSSQLALAHLASRESLGTGNLGQVLHLDSVFSGNTA